MKKTALLLFVILASVCMVASGQTRKRQQGKAKAKTTATVVGHTYQCDNYGGNTINSTGARLCMTVTFISENKVIMESEIVEQPTGIFDTPRIHARLSLFESSFFNGTKKVEKNNGYYEIIDTDGEVITRFSPRKGSLELVEKDTDNLFKRIK